MNLSNSVKFYPYMIQVINLTKYYGKFQALDNISFHLKKGEICGLLGLNGSGKTTTIRILSNYLIPSSGQGFIDGMDIFLNPMESKRKIGYLPEVPPLYLELSVYDYLTFVARIKSIPTKEIHSEIHRVTEKTALIETLDKIIGHLSLGYRKRVGIAQALLGDPPVIIMDEPISGLDPRQIVEMRNLVRGLSGKHTLLISSHILSEMYRTCDRYLILDKGKLVAEYTQSELEKEMDKLSLLEIVMSGDKNLCMATLKKALEFSKGSFETKGEDLNGYLYFVKTQNESRFKDDLVNLVAKSNLHIELIKKQEVTLEQIFIQKL